MYIKDIYIERRIEWCRHYFINTVCAYFLHIISMARIVYEWKSYKQNNVNEYLYITTCDSYATV